MAWGRGIFRGVLAGVLVLAAGPVFVAPWCAAQSSVTLTEPPVNLLPASFDGWKQSAQGAVAAAPEGSLFLLSLLNGNKQALDECGPLRSLAEEYSRAGRSVRVEAMEFGDRTGAYSAFTLVERTGIRLGMRLGMRPGTDLGAESAVGDDAVLFTQGDTLVLASPAGSADVPALRQLARALPKATGNRGVNPLLPSLAPAAHRVPGSLRYALGPATYAAEGGVLPPNALAWDKSAEVVTAAYATKAGPETLTLLLYPTPQIAEAVEATLKAGMASPGPGFATAKVRRENELLMVASGSLAAGEAQAMLAGVHLRQEVSVDRDITPSFHFEVQRTFSLLTNIAILAGVLMAAAVLLGLFLGGGRALFRVLRGKPAASEPEFLSLHLAPQNPTPKLDSIEPKSRS